MKNVHRLEKGANLSLLFTHIVFNVWPSAFPAMQIDVS